MYKKHILSFTVAIILLFTQVVILAHEENQSTSQSAEIPYEEVIENNSDAATSYNDTIKTEIENLTEEYTYKYIVKKTNNRISDRAIDKAYSAAKDDKVQEINELKQTNEEEFARLDLDNSLEDNKIEISEDARNILKSIDDTEAYNNDINVQDLSEDIVVLELPESVKADIFVEKFLSETKGDIEYIQPDYKLEISDFDENSAEKDDLNLNIEENKSDNAQEDIIVDIEIVGEGESNNDLSNINQDNSSTSTHELSTANPETSEMTDNTDITATQEPVTTISPDMDVVNVLQDDIQSAWQITKGSNVRIAVIDSKMDVTHPDLSSHITNGFDVLTNSELIYNEEIKGQYYHGTHVTGIIASTVPDAEIIPITAFNDGQAYTSDLIKAIEYAKEQGADIVNCSWGSTDDNPALKEAMQDSGMLFVCAAGNNRMNVDETAIYPACFDIDNVISVTSLNQDLGFSYYSNHGESVDIAMYGRNVNSTLPGGEYGEQSGTSMAAAYVTAGAAMLKSVNSEVNIKDTVIDTAVSLSNLENKVRDGKKLCYANLVHNIINDNVIEISPEDDFDVNGYERTPAENWELFSSLKVVDVEAGGNNTAFIMSDGSLWMTGDNTYGQLGNGTYERSNVPTRVIGLNNIVQVAVGENHCIALDGYGYAYVWGNNEYHAVSSSNDSYIAIPVIHTMSEITYIEAGSQTTFVIKRHASVYGQGQNNYGQLGNGTKNTALTPTKVNNVVNANIVKSYGKHSFFIDIDTVFSCGSNDNNVLNSVDKTVLTPLPVCKAGKIDTGKNHAVIIDEIGTVQSWGTNEWGQCGTGLNGDNLVEIYNAVDIKCGKEHTIALLDDGTVATWGYNNSGQIGDGTKDKYYEPYFIDQLSNIVKIAAGDNHTVALDANGKVWVWGNNNQGQYGNGNNKSLRIPTAINLVYNDLYSTTKDISIDSGNDYTIVLTSRNLNMSGNTKFIVTYDSSALELIDAAEYTFEKNLQIGSVKGADLYIDKQINGELTFRKSISSASYTGFLNSIKFKAKKSCNTSIRLTIQ